MFDRWSLALGEIALACLAVLVVTGAYLAFVFVPSSAEVVYQGSYPPLRGATMSAAYASTLDISFDLRAGLVLRQMHHWAASILVATLVAYVGRLFLVGAFRRPGGLAWTAGIAALVVSVATGFLGYSLVGDSVSGAGVRVAYAVALSVPLVGEWLATVVFGGELAAGGFVARFFVLHTALLPAVLVGLVVTSLALSGLRWLGATRWAGLLLTVAGALAALGGLVQISPVWLHGPFDPARAAVTTAGTQTDWYLGWLDGALRLMPGRELRVAGRTVPGPFLPGVVLPVATVGLLCLWPRLERRRTGDPGPHHRPDRPSDAPGRTAVGAATLSFYALLVVAGSTDVLSSVFAVTLASITALFRLLVVVVPLVVFVLTRHVCRSPARYPLAPVPAGARLRRTASGGYEAVAADAERPPAAVSAGVIAAEHEAFRRPPADG